MYKVEYVSMRPGTKNIDCSYAILKCVTALSIIEIPNALEQYCESKETKLTEIRSISQYQPQELDHILL